MKDDPQELEEEHAMNEEVDVDPYVTRTRRVQREVKRTRIGNQEVKRIERDPKPSHQ